MDYIYTDDAMKFLRSAIVAASLLGLTGTSRAIAQTAPATQSPSSKQTKSTAAATPSPQDIADAKAKGMVWVNLNTHVYHKDGRFYGTTKNGKFMTEADAQKAGFREAKTGAAGKKTTSTSTSK